MRVISHLGKRSASRQSHFWNVIFLMLLIFVHRRRWEENQSVYKAKENKMKTYLASIPTNKKVIFKSAGLNDHSHAIMKSRKYIKNLEKELAVNVVKAEEDALNTLANSFKSEETYFI